MDNLITLNNVCYEYDDVTALKNININISSNEAVTLIGSNGCGKSTLLKLINGLIMPSGGEYLFDNEQINAKKFKNQKFSKEFHKKIGFVFQNPEHQLFCQSVYDEIAFGPRQLQMSEDEVTLRVNDCIKLLGLEGFEKRIPIALSGGEKRKVAIAAVLSLNPQIIVMDEPMEGLDPKSQQWLIEFIRFIHENGKTVIITTHNLKILSDISDRTIVFNTEHMIEADKSSTDVMKDEELLRKTGLIL